jgi:hypothetical protein
MTIDEAIRHCEEVAEGLEKKAMCIEEAYQTTEQQNCEQCAADHRQLAEWLTELKELRETHNAEVSIGGFFEDTNKILIDRIKELEEENEEAKRLLKLAVDDANSETESLCAFCKHNDTNDGCPYIENYSECEYVWRYTDEALKLIES